MKKVISILLCALMLVSSFAFSASAANPIEAFGDENGTSVEISYGFDLDDPTVNPDWVSNRDYVIRKGCTFVVPSGRTLNVPLNSTLTVEPGAHFVVNGQLNVAGEMFVYGKLTGTNITGSGNIKCEVRFPSLADANVNLNNKIEVRYYVSPLQGDEYGDINVPIENYTAVASDGAKIMVDYNKYLYIRILIKEAPGEDRYDDKKYPVFYNSSKVDFKQNGCPVLVITSGDVSYGSWMQDTTYYNTYKITLPEGEGYTVYGRNGEFGEVTLKYGQAFSFRVELEEDFDKSDYLVYVYNGNGWTNLEKDDLLAGIEPAKPDAEGYYTINSITGEYSIFVEGVVSNEMLDIFSQVFTIFRQIWETITEIFNELFGGMNLGDMFA